MHRGDGGIQEHSCGPIMPWMTVIRSGPDLGVVYAMHGGTGEKLAEHAFRWSVEREHPDGFYTAHALAENDARRALGLELVEVPCLLPIPFRADHTVANIPFEGIRRLPVESRNQLYGS